MKKYPTCTLLLLAFLSTVSDAFHVNYPHSIRSIRGRLNSVQTYYRTASIPFDCNDFTRHKHTGTSTTSSSMTALKNSLKNDDMIEKEVDEPIFSGKTTISLIGAQSVLVAVAVAAANILNVPNNGLGDGFIADSMSIQSGLLATLPLFVLAFILDFVEKKVPALQDVSKATQGSVLALLGGTRKPLIAIGVSIALGAAAGLGEEMLFRGILQSELGDRFGDIAALTSSAVIFGALHAVTPLYAVLASLASLYFGELYLQYHNLAVPIVCHGVYDVGALFAAHIQVTGMSTQERKDLQTWVPGNKEE